MSSPHIPSACHDADIAVARDAANGLGLPSELHQTVFRQGQYDLILTPESSSKLMVGGYIMASARTFRPPRSKILRRRIRVDMVVELEQEL